LISAVDHGVTEETLRRLGARYSTALPKGNPLEITTQIRTILIDRDALAEWKSDDPRFATLRTWVGNGGRLVVLPQGGTAARQLPGAEGITFERNQGLSPAEPVSVTPDPVFTTPNELSASDWSDWVVARSWGEIKATSPAAQVLLRAQTTGRPLMVRTTLGEGSVTFVGLDLISQFQNIHPGAFRLLANLCFVNPGFRE
jgi:hypothetical protein